MSWSRLKIIEHMLPREHKAAVQSQCRSINISEVHCDGLRDLHEAVGNVILDMSTMAGKLSNPSGSVLVQTDEDIRLQ